MEVEELEGLRAQMLSEQKEQAEKALTASGDEAQRAQLLVTKLEAEKVSLR